MAVVQVPGWWVYTVNSMEIGAYESEETANAVAEGNAYSGFPVIVIPGTIFKEED